MDDSRIPWWLVLLVGISVIGLAGWQSSRFKPQMRLGAGGLALAYLALLAFAIGGDPRGLATARAWRLPELLTVGLSGVSLVAAVLLVGRPSLRGQLIWFGVMSLANAGLASLHAGTNLIPLMLILPVIVIVYWQVREVRRGATFRMADLWPASSMHGDSAGRGNSAAPGDSPSRHDSPVQHDESPFHPWLTAGTGLAIAVLLVGTCYHALHAESTRASPSPRHSAFPARSRVRTVLGIEPDQERSVTSASIMFVQRVDVVVLLGVLSLVTLASAGMSRSPLGLDQETWRDDPKTSETPTRKVSHPSE